MIVYLEVLQLKHGVESVYIIMITLWLSIDEYKDDDKAFIFTLKNRHGIEPSKFMKKKDSEEAIYCDPYYGPMFGSGEDIGIFDNCNDEGGWTNYGYGSYECKNSLKKSLFVNTAGPDQQNNFKVSDYEVFTYN